MIAFSLSQVIFVPIIAAILVLIVGKALGKKVGWISFVSLVYVLALLGIESYNLPNTGYKLTESYKWAPFIGNFTLLLDGVSCVIALTITLLSAAISVYSIKYMEHEENIGIYNTLYLLYFSGMVGTVLSTNLAIFFLFFELMLIPSWILIGIWGTGDKARVAFKYFMFTEVGAVILLAGIGATYMLYGTFDIFEIGAIKILVKKELLIPIVGMILLGLFVKMAIFPLHTWLPDAHAEAPTPISALLSPSMIGIGF